MNPAQNKPKMVLPASITKHVKAFGINIGQKKIMDIAKLVSKMKSIKNKDQKKETIFILILNAKDANRNLF